jgi:hypothetical protein
VEEETHGTSGQCVSFSLIDAGKSFAACVVFLFFSFLFLSSAAHTTQIYGESRFRCPVAGRKKRKRPREPERVQSVRLSDWAEKWAICKHGQEALIIGGGAVGGGVSYYDNIKYSLDKIQDTSTAENLHLSPNRPLLGPIA